MKTAAKPVVLLIFLINSSLILQCWVFNYCLHIYQKFSQNTNYIQCYLFYALQKKVKVAAQRRVEEELLHEDSQFSPSSASQESDDGTRDLQSQIKSLKKENFKLRNMVVKGMYKVLGYLKKKKSVLGNTFYFW